MAPTCVRLGSRATLAIPKSVTTALPSSSSRMLAGLMSRCTTPRRCAYPNAPAIWDSHTLTTEIGNGPSLRITASSDGPATNFITKYWTFSVSSTV